MMRKRTIEIATANGCAYNSAIDTFRKGRCQIEQNGSGPGYQVYCFTLEFGNPDNHLVRSTWAKDIHGAIEAVNAWNKGA